MSTPKDEKVIAAEFKHGYTKSKTWADLESVIKHTLVPKQVDKLLSSLETVKEYTDIDMRQNFLLGLLRSMRKFT